MITGAGSGLGRSLALEFAKLGWKIAIADIDNDRIDESVKLANEEGGEAIKINCDVTKYKDLEKAVLILRKEWDGVDIIVNNAGVAAAGYMEKIGMDRWDWIIDINLKGVIHGCRVFIPLLEKQGGGHIINVASNAGIASFPEMSCYNVTKAGVISLSETLRVELAPKNIGVTVVCPTFFKTNLMDQFNSPDERQRKMANKFFEKSSVTTEQVSKHIMKSLKKNKFYVITQLDGKFAWIFKRYFPELYFKIISSAYKKGIIDKYLGLS